MLLIGGGIMSALGTAAGAATGLEQLMVERLDGVALESSTAGTTPVLATLPTWNYTPERAEFHRCEQGAGNQ